MIFQYITNLIAGTLLYRAGGAIEKKMRKIGTNLCSVAILTNIYGFNWEICLVMIIQYFTLGTYWKGDEPDVLWYHWIFTGLGYGLSVLPLLFCGAEIGIILLRTYILTLGCVVVSEGSANVWIEEYGRGSLMVGTMIML